jgi:hypothetical protein
MVRACCLCCVNRNTCSTTRGTSPLSVRSVTTAVCIRRMSSDTLQYTTRTSMYTHTKDIIRHSAIHNKDKYVHTHTGYHQTLCNTQQGQECIRAHTYTGCDQGTPQYTTRTSMFSPATMWAIPLWAQYNSPDLQYIYCFLRVQIDRRDIKIQFNQSIINRNLFFFLSQENKDWVSKYSPFLNLWIFSYHSKTFLSRSSLYKRTNKISVLYQV